MPMERTSLRLDRKNVTDIEWIKSVMKDTQGPLNPAMVDTIRLALEVCSQPGPLSFLVLEDEQTGELYYTLQSDEYLLLYNKQHVLSRIWLIDHVRKHYVISNNRIVPITAQVLVNNHVEFL